MAHVLDDQIETIALPTGFSFGVLQFDEVVRQLFVCFAQISYVAKDRHQAERLATRVRSGSRNDFEVNVGTLDWIDESDVTLNHFGRRDRSAREVRRKQQVVHLERA